MFCQFDKKITNINESNKLKLIRTLSESNPQLFRTRNHRQCPPPRIQMELNRRRRNAIFLSGHRVVEQMGNISKRDPLLDLSFTTPLARRGHDRDWNFRVDPFGINWRNVFFVALNGHSCDVHCWRRQECERRGEVFGWENWRWKRVLWSWEFKHCCWWEMLMVLECVWEGNGGGRNGESKNEREWRKREVMKIWLLLR